jgi:hypothetical protein
MMGCESRITVVCRDWRAIDIESQDHLAQIRLFIECASSYARWAKRGYDPVTAAADYYDCLQSLADARRVFTWIKTEVSE